LTKALGSFELFPERGIEVLLDIGVVTKFIDLFGPLDVNLLVGESQSKD
jgi:hypothetical protein